MRFVNKTHSINLNFLPTEIYSVRKHRDFAWYTPYIMADVTEKPYLSYHSWTLVYVHGYELVIHVCVRVQTL